MPNTIAVLGWGSLIWDRHVDFDGQVGDWNRGGPELRLEFCRVSASRSNALTLVIDDVLGTPVETLYAISKRIALNDAITDLRRREGTSTSHIGFIDRVSDTHRGRDARAIVSIQQWAERKNLQSVIWTDLPPNFPPEFSLFPNAALSHLRNLPHEGLVRAIEYIVKAPPQITTRLRTAITGDAHLSRHIADLFKVLR